MPVDDTTKTLDGPVVGTREHLAGLEGLTQPSEWSSAPVRLRGGHADLDGELRGICGGGCSRCYPPPTGQGPTCVSSWRRWPKEQPAPTQDEDEEPAVFPCIECSIYFRQKEHLLEHMSQHRRAPGQEPPAELAPLACGECGWAFGHPGASSGTASCTRPPGRRSLRRSRS